MTQEKINLAELLKDCPKGMELDCVLYNDVTFVCVLDGLYPIQIRTPEGSVRISKYGGMSLGAHAKCIIFPKCKTTWEGFVPPCKFKDGDIVVNASNKDSNAFIYAGEGDNYYHSYVGLTPGTYPELFTNKSLAAVSKKSGIRFATEEEKEKLFQVIKDNGYEWNEETKTLKKLIKPKFKVGDRIKWKGHDACGRIEKIEDNVYHVDYGYDDGFIRVNLNMQDDYDLVPNKFDINTLIPFESKVLVRDLKDEAWRPAIYGFYLSDVSQYYVVVGGFCWKYLIPYEGNEHLMGTNDDCDEFYKNWQSQIIKSL